MNAERPAGESASARPSAAERDGAQYDVPDSVMLHNAAESTAPGAERFIVLGQCESATRNELPGKAGQSKV